MYVPRWISPDASPTRRRPVWVRYVLVPGVTDDPDDIAKVASFAGGLGNVQRVDVLPFHQMGRFKWKELGIPYTLENVETPTNDAVERSMHDFSDGGTESLLTNS